jgi:4-amino-4-deoxy-L-arabinose transferase-like glycosyltransferase
MTAETNSTTATAPAATWRQRLPSWLGSPRLLAALLGVLTVLLLLRGEPQIGYVRDEGVYFEASRHYAAWVMRWLDEDDETSASAKANTPEIRDRYFGINHEHPALMKLAAGLSARLLAKPPGDEVIAEIDAVENARKRAWRQELAAVDGGRFHVLREGAAMRLPAILLAGLAAMLLFGAGRRLGGGNLGGLLAVGCFLLLPHVAFHASLHAFDVPIAVMTLVVALAWLRALSDWRWGVLLGPLLGVAIAVKHNALFLGPLLAMHLWVMLALRWRFEGERPRLRQLLPLPLWSMAVLGPLVAWMLWPWMWHDTLARLAEYFTFHREHSYYNMEFLGENWNRPPLPISYPFVMTWATVPSAVLLLVVTGVLLSLRTLREPRALRHLGRFGDNRRGPLASRFGARARRQGDVNPLPGWSAPLPVFDGREEPLLYVGLAVFPLALIALPSVPIFGGTKHWLTAYPFFALLAAMAWGRLWWRAQTLLRAWPKLLRFAPSVVLISVLTPGTWATVHGHPFNLSQYAPLAGGARGAAVLGLNRGFWGHAIVPLLDAEVLAGERVYIHDVHRLALEQYRREGRWPGWRATGVDRAEAALLFPEMHMLSDEIAIWDSLGTVQPSMVLTLDDVPITIVYERVR